MIKKTAPRKKTVLRVTRRKGIRRRPAYRICQTAEAIKLVRKDSSHPIFVSPSNDSTILHLALASKRDFVMKTPTTRSRPFVVGSIRAVPHRQVARKCRRANAGAPWHRSRLVSPGLWLPNVPCSLVPASVDRLLAAARRRRGDGFLLGGRHRHSDRSEYVLLSQPRAYRRGSRPKRSQRFPSRSRNSASRPYGSSRGDETNCTPAATMRW
jgi:hypothetical protein